jgi:hypothetical protein
MKRSRGKVLSSDSENIENMNLSPTKKMVLSEIKISDANAARIENAKKARIAKIAKRKNKGKTL